MGYDKGMKNDPHPTRGNGYPWHRFANGQWHELRELPRVYAELNEGETLASYFEAKPWAVPNISATLRVSAAKWAKRRGKKAEIRSDSHERKIFIRFIEEAQ